MKIPKLARLRIAMGAGVLLIVVIVGGLGWAFFKQLSLGAEFREEARQLERALATQEARQAYLTATLTYVHTDAYVEEWSREEAKMAKPGEVVFIPFAGDGGDASESTPTAEPDVAPPPSDDRSFWTIIWLAITGSEE